MLRQLFRQEKLLHSDAYENTVFVKMVHCASVN